MSHFYFVDNILQYFGLDGPKRLGIGALAQEAHDPVLLLDAGFIVASQASVTHNLGAMSALLGVHRHRKTCGTTQ